MSVGFLVGTSTNRRDLCCQAFHSREVPCCEPAHIRCYRRSREAGSNNRGRHLGRDGSRETIGEHGNIYSRAHGADGAADGTGHANGRSDFLLVFNLDAGVGEADGLVPADEEAAERHEHDGSVFGIGRAGRHRAQERAANGEHEDALQLRLPDGDGKAAPDDLAGDDESAGDAVQPAGVHGGAAVVGVEHGDHGGPDDGHGVVDTGSQSKEQDRGHPAGVFKEVHGNQRFFVGCFEFPDNEGDETYYPGGQGPDNVSMSTTESASVILRHLQIDCEHGTYPDFHAYSEPPQLNPITKSNKPAVKSRHPIKSKSLKTCILLRRLCFISKVGGW